MQVKCDELERCAGGEIPRTMFQNENGNLQEAATATAGRDLTAKANLPAQGAVAVIFEADVHATEAKTGHEIKSSEHGPSGKRSRLN
jgi:hypothetical protein